MQVAVSCSLSARIPASKPHIQATSSDINNQISRRLSRKAGSPRYV